MWIFAALMFAIQLSLIPAHALDEGIRAQARDIITSQLQAFERGDAAGAYQHAAPSITRMFPQPDIFMSMVQQGYAPVYRHQSFEFGEARESEGKFAQSVRIVDMDGVPWEALYSLEQQPDGSWKISGCFLLKAQDLPA